MSEYILKVPEYESPYDPAVQAASLGEEIVRCRDCRYASYDSRWCYRLLNAEEPPITPDGFCAWGERK